MFEPDGETLTRDVNNPDESLCNRTIQDLVIITDFEYEDGEWTGGEIYDPQNGRTYRGRMRIEDGDLHLRAIHKRCAVRQNRGVGESGTLIIGGYGKVG